MTDFIQVIRQEHRNIESLLRVLERELTLFDRGERLDYEVVLAIIDYFRDYPDSCHHPKEDMIVEKIKARDPVATATIGNLEAEHGEGTRRLRRVSEAQKGHRRNSSTRSSSLSAAIPCWLSPHRTGDPSASQSRPRLLRENDLANRRPPMRSLITTLGGTIAAVCPDADRSVIYDFAIDWTAS
jgi:hypothetical protein